MVLADLLVLPLFWGLIGSVEPCSIGINSIFLAHTNKFERSRRILEALKFTLARALILALIGLTAAFAGNRFFSFQSSYNIAFGIFYIFLGIVLIISRKWSIPMPNIDISQILKRKTFSEGNKTLAMGAAFGFAIPVCAVPFIAALLGKSLLSGDLFFGFLSLFIFGTALSLPLLPLSYSEKGHAIMGKIAKKSYLTYYIGGLALIVLGIFTIYSWVFVYPKYLP
ncbi:MAG: cytochrome c biogenesis protein CcdA [Candidatus Hydrothermarchaeaceae archaeon]